MAIKFRQLKTSHCLEFQQLLSIYRESFPSEERQPDSFLAENIDSGLSRAFIAAANKNVIFFVRAYDVPQTRLIFLDYAATHPAYRGKQICLHFFKQAFSLFGHDRILFCQQEAPNHGDNRSIKCKRITYFSSMGFQYLHDVPIMMPNHADGTHLIPMVLASMAESPIPRLFGQQIAEAVSFIFTPVYRRSEEKWPQIFER